MRRLICPLQFQYMSIQTLLQTWCWMKCLSKLFVASQNEQKPNKVEFEHSTAAAILSIESIDMSDAIGISSELKYDLDKNKIKEADFITANIDSQPFVIVTRDTKSEIERHEALSITSIYTNLVKSGVASSLFDEIPDNSGAYRYTLISKNVAAQHMLLHFPFDPGSGGLVFDNVVLVFDNSLQLILLCTAPISTNEFVENHMIPIASKVFAGRPQQDKCGQLSHFATTFIVPSANLVVDKEYLMTQLALDSTCSLPSPLLPTSMCLHVVKYTLLTFPLQGTHSLRQCDWKPHFIILDYLLASSLEALLSLDDFELLWQSSLDALELSMEFAPKLFPAMSYKVPPKDIPSPKHSGLSLNACMLHSLGHMELNAIDLAWDTVVRFSSYSDLQGDGFFADFAHVADDESRHLAWCSQRLSELGVREDLMPNRVTSMPSEDGARVLIAATPDEDKKEEESKEEFASISLDI